MGLTRLQAKEYAKNNKTSVDFIEDEMAKVLRGMYPAAGEIFVSSDALYGRLFVVCKSEVWVLRASEGWFAGLHRAADSEDVRRLSRFLETSFRSEPVRLEVQKWIDHRVSRKQQPTASNKKRAGVSPGRNRRSEGR